MRTNWQHTRAFVVQFDLDVPNIERQLQGRTEHISSGQATRFSSTEELVTFMTSILANLNRKPSEDSDLTCEPGEPGEPGEPTA